MIVYNNFSSKESLSFQHLWSGFDALPLLSVVECFWCEYIQETRDHQVAMIKPFRIKASDPTKVLLWNRPIADHQTVTVPFIWHWLAFGTRFGTVSQLVIAGAHIQSTFPLRSHPNQEMVPRLV